MNFTLKHYIPWLLYLLLSIAVYASPNPEGIQIYQKNLPLSPEHKQKLADDILRYRTADNLWDALREEFTLPHYEESPIVQEKIEWFMNNQDYLMRSAMRAAPYLYYISQQVHKRHLPAELVLLPIIESGYNPYSLSNMGAAGIWQLMPNTATGLGIRQDWWYDGRRDVIASTRAALTHLAYLQTFFDGNWLLAIAAYNTGEGNVLSAIKRNIREGRSTDFWSLPVAQQTKDYVPSLLALATIISHPEQYPVYLPPVRNAPYLAQIEVGSPINLKYAAELAGLNYKTLMQLNSGFNRPALSNKGPYKLVLPIENVEQFSENLANTPLGQPIRWIHYKVKAGDTLASIAKKFNVTLADIRNMNQLGTNNIHRGTNLLIPNHASFSNPEEPLTPEATPIKRRENIFLATSLTKNLNRTTPESYTLQPGDTIYMVRAHDTLETIAKRFHVSVQAIRLANALSTAGVYPGKELILPTHNAAPINDKQIPNQSLSPGDTLYMVRSGDTIEKIADKFHTTPSAIRIANLMASNSIQEGDSLVIPTHSRG